MNEVSQETMMFKRPEEQLDVAETIKRSICCIRS